MSGDAVLVLIIAAGAVVLFVTELVPPDIVALIVMVSLGLTGVLELPQLFAGFGSPVILTLMGIFVLTSALQNTGVAALGSQFLLRFTRYTDEHLLVGLLALGAAITSFFMNTVAAVALVAPVGRQVSYRRGISPSRLLMPVSYGALLGGMATILTTSNLVLLDMLTQAGQRPFRFLEFLPVGGPITLAGILYLTTMTRRILPERASSDPLHAAQAERFALPDTYQLSTRLFEAALAEGSPLEGRLLSECGFGEQFGVTIPAVRRRRRVFTPPSLQFVLRTGDRLLLQGRPEEVARAAEQFGLLLNEAPGSTYSLLAGGSGELAEITLTPRAELAGQSLAEIGFREKYRVNVLGIWHEGRPIRSFLGEHILELGDGLLVQGSPAALRTLSQDSNFLMLTQLPETPENTDRALVALVILIAFLMVIVLDVVPVALAALLAGIAVILTGCQSIEQARQSVQWQVIFLIGGMLSLTTALEATGAKDMLVQALLPLLTGGGERGIVLAFFLLTMLLTQLTSGQSAALLIGPIAVSIAIQQGIDPHMTAMAVGIGASAAFLTPVAHPANLLVLGPGGYRFRDYALLGFPLVVLTALGAALLIPLVY
ncbi:MAG: SLC13 family permease [Anaerolineae bacterium]|nr:SLC13 family permease [Anaerolineae bacterium]